METTAMMYIIEGSMTICNDQRDDQNWVEIDKHRIDDLVAKWAKENGICDSCWHHPHKARKARITIELLDDSENDPV